MKIDEILNNYYGIENKDMIYFYYMIINLIDYFDLSDFINNIEISNSLETGLSLYDYNSKTLAFGNNIFDTNLYNVNSNKAMVYILHELIHVLQAKYISTYKKFNVFEFNILKTSFLNNDYIYSSIMPLHEYQAFFNSNYLLYDYLFRNNKLKDIDNFTSIIITLLYNNYYDSKLNFISPIEQTIRRFNLNNNYNNDFYSDKEINSRLLFGMPILESDFKSKIKSIRGKRSWKNVLSINKRRIKKRKKA